MSQPQNPQSSSSSKIKPNIALKKLQGSSHTIIVRSPENNVISLGESTMSTLEGVVQESQPAGSPIYLVEPEEIGHQEPSERSQKSYENMFVEAQASSYVVYKSTLANLSDGLATLNEGDYMQWDNCVEQKAQNATNIPSQKSIESTNRRHRPMSVHMRAPPGTCENSRVETPMCVKDNPVRKSVVNKINTRILRNLGPGDMDFVIRKNYDSAIPSQNYIRPENDFRWKGSGSMHEALEKMKTEESIEAAARRMLIQNRENNEEICVPVVVPKESTQRSSSVNRRPLIQELEEWKAMLIERKEALAAGKKVMKKEKIVQEIKKEDMVLPKLIIGSDNLGSPPKHEANKDAHKHTGRFGEMKKTKPKWGASSRPSSKKKGLYINVKENRENMLSQSHCQEGQTVVESQKNMRDMKPIGRLRSQGSASMVVWDEETLLQNLDLKCNEEGKTQTEQEKEQWKQRCLVPKMKIKQDIIMKKQLLLMQNRVKSRAESRERSTEVKYDIDKVIRGHKEIVNRMMGNGMEAFYSCGNDGSGEVCTAQTILDQRLRTLEEKYVKREDVGILKEHRRSFEQKRLSKSSLVGEQEHSKSKGRESGKVAKVNFVMNLKKVERSGRNVL